MTALADPWPGRIGAAISAAWRRLPTDLAQDVLEGVFIPHPGDAAIAALIASDRLRERLAERIAERLGIDRPTTADFADPPSRILLLGPAALEEAIRLAGVVRHGDRIGRLLLRREREEVAEALGRDGYDLALSRPRDAGASAPTESVATLIADCRRDGPLCFAAWTRSLPAPVATWMQALSPWIATSASGATEGRDAAEDISAAREGAAAVLRRNHG